MLWHDDFFTLQDGEVKPIIKIGKFGGRFTILHPYFHFGSLENPVIREEEAEAEEEGFKVYFQQFKIDLSQDDFDIDDFVKEVEKNYHLKEDEALYFETGFWSGVRGADLYMGMGTNKLKEALESNTIFDFAICFSSNVSILVISSINKGKNVFISLYASNDLIPFVEVVEPFRKALRNYKSTSEISSEVLPERKLRRYWMGNKLTTLSPIAFLMDLRDKNYKRLPIVQNHFVKTRDDVIKKIDYLIGVTSGGFIESDYDGKRKFLLRAEIWELSNASVVEFVFDQTLL